MIQVNDIRGSDYMYFPSDIQSAKDFLRRSYDSLTAPHISRMNTCHGCHGPVGEGAHVGSAVGKSRFTLPHSFYVYSLLKHIP